MPILKSAKKRVRQAAVRQKRNYATRRKVKSAIKDITDLVKAKKMDEATQKLPAAYKAIDTAAKKNVLHENNAARKKSRLAKLIATK